MGNSTTVKSTPYIDELTGLRGIAALWVVIFHLQYGFAFCPEFYFRFFANQIVQKGYLAVDFFFILSGFVMAISAQSWDGLKLPKYFFNFIRSRLARIYPMHLITLMSMTVIYLVTAKMSPVFHKTIAAQLLLAHAWGHYFPGDFNYPSWSISAEWSAYLLFPILLLTSRYVSRWPIALLTSIATSAAILTWIARTFKHGSLDLTWDWGWARCLTEFWIGLCIYQLRVRLISFGAKTKNSLAVFVIFSTALFFLLKGTDAWIIPIAAMTVLSVSLESVVWRNIFANRFSQYMGRISYSIYMLHVPVSLSFLKLWETYFGPTTYFWIGALALALSLVLLVSISALSYHFVELPLRLWLTGRKRKWVSAGVSHEDRSAA